MSEELMFPRIDRLLARIDPSASRARWKPATPDQLAGLARHWGRPLPMLYRRVLEIYNGQFKLWYGYVWLSTNEIVADPLELRALAPKCPALCHTIFARGTARRDALAFDFAALDAQGEPAVVHLTAAGEDRRWPSLDALLQDLHLRMMFGADDGGSKTYCIWTTLFSTWLDDCTPSSRIYTAGGRARSFADAVSLGPDAGASLPSPFLPPAKLAAADQRFERAAQGLAESGVAIVLCDSSSEDAARSLYVIYEPCAILTFALDVTTGGTTATTDDGAWDRQGPALDELMRHAGALARQARIAEAIEYSLEETSRIARALLA